MVISKLNKIRFFVVSFIFAHRNYKKIILETPYFKSIGAVGWQWAYYDRKDRRLNGKNKDVPFPVGGGTIVNHPENIEFDCNNLELFQTPGCYFQGIGAKTKFGKNCIVAPNCGFITANHDVNAYKQHDAGKDIVIGDNCWIGMNSVILPGVTLGYHTIVGAGSVVTKSFPEGNCVIAGNPAKKIKELNEYVKKV